MSRKRLGREVTNYVGPYL